MYEYNLLDPRKIMRWMCLCCLCYLFKLALKFLESSRGTVLVDMPLDVQMNWINIPVSIKPRFLTEVRFYYIDRPKKKALSLIIFFLKAKSLILSINKMKIISEFSHSSPCITIGSTDFMVWKPTSRDFEDLRQECSRAEFSKLWPLLLK
jgi:hypothetical protein